MSTLKIERDKQYKLRNRLVVRVLATDGVGSYPVVVQYPDGGFSRHNADGSHHHESDFDIIAEHREPRTIYVNFYPLHVVGHPTEEDARDRAASGALEVAIPFREVMP